MPWKIERLRAAIVALAVLLLAVIFGSFLYGRWRLRRLAQDLPAKLGLEIQQTAQGFVLSESNREGRTLFTLRAARAVKFKLGGRVSLHDVKIDLYNGSDNRPDTIAGKDFEYDPGSQVVESKGEAHMVLQPPADAAGKTAAPVEVTTHDLVFNRKTGVASSSGEVDFAAGDSSGQATGAEYDSKQGHLLLDSAVVLRTEVQGVPAVLHASHGAYDRVRQQVELWQPRYESARENASADQAILELPRKGVAERLDAKGNVRLRTADGMDVRAAAMQVMFQENHRPAAAEFPAGAQFASKGSRGEMAGTAGRVHIGFNGQGEAERAVLDGAVQLNQQASTGAGQAERSLSAGHVVLQLVPGRSGQIQMQTAEATGNSVLRSSSVERGKPARRTTLAAENLHASFAAENEIRELHGSGQTRLETLAANSDVDSSTSDTLAAEFTPGKSGEDAAASPLRTAVQAGHVVLRQVAKGRDPSTATAQMASYTAADGRMVLTGQPVLRNAQMEMAATRMEWMQAAGTLTAGGNVLATLLPQSRRSGTMQLAGPLGGRDRAHVIAEKAVFVHDRGTAVFSGRARLWQGSDSVEAPVIELSETRRTLAAYAEGGCTQCVVSVFSGSEGADRGTPAVFRVLSSRLLYSDAERTASFSRPVQLTGADSRLTADEVKIVLSPAAPARAAAGSTAFMERGKAAQSSVEKIIAAGDVRLKQPGRSATGEKLEYTAEDGHFVLTGEPDRLPQVTDADRGTVTGQVLTFASREQAIMVSGTAGHSTTTKTRVQKR